MKTNLTNEQIANIFALYYRAFIIIADYGKYRMLGIYDTDILIKNGTKHPVSSCKLELIPLKSITDEHAIEVAKMNKYTADVDIAFYAMVGRDILNQVFAKNSLMCLPYECADKLRQWGYCLPYDGIDLFEVGIAIEKK